MIRDNGAYEDVHRDSQRHSGIQPRANRAAQYALRFYGREHWLLDEETLVGRSSTCDIILATALVSRKHAKLSLSGSSVEITDLDSTNGVTVNAVSIHEPTELRPGDIIGIGGALLELFELTFVEADEEQGIPLNALATPAVPSFEEPGAAAVGGLRRSG